MKRKNFILLLIFTTLSLMVVALYNGFPLTESDSGSYIEKGIFNIIPHDRSPFYCWFLRYTSMWTSLWFTVFAQCFILAYVLLHYFQLIQSKALEFRLAMVTTIAIVSFTCVSWVTGYLMPDIFGGILLLSILLFLSNKPGGTKLQLIYCLIIFAAIIIHNSHFLIVLLFSSVLTAYGLIKKYKVLVQKSLTLLSMSLLGWLLMCTINAASGSGFTFSRGSHVFMVTKFAETGILNRYLSENCSTKKLKMCDYQDKIPTMSYDFLWLPQSPLYLTGGWDSNKVDFNIMIHDVFTTPRYLKMFIEKSSIATMREMCQVQAPDNVTYQGNWASVAWQRVGTFFSDELNEYTLSKQNTESISATNCNIVYYLFFILSTIWVLFLPGLLSREIKFIYSCMLLFFFFNAFVTSTFSTVIYRFQYRVFWILPATNAILLIKYYWEKNQEQMKSE